MHTIFFCNGAIVDAVNARQCQCADYYDALGVFDALCRLFLVVELYDAQGVKLRGYDNR